MKRKLIKTNKKNEQIYLKVMHKVTKIMLMKSTINSSEDNEVFIIYKNCVENSGPILCAYVLWILKKAEKQRIEHLYFLARDAKVLYELAKIFVEHFNLPVKCHYLYCSRLALRKTLYYINSQEALEKWCENGMEVTPQVIMERTGLNSDEIDTILNDIGISNENRKKLLSGRGTQEMRKKLASSDLFHKFVLCRSGQAFDNTLAYFEQEGLLSNTRVALVDSGWSGSMQRCIRLIIEKAGYYQPLSGFYFGMFRKTMVEDGKYHCFYFNHKAKVWNSILFNHNLFECWCLADHGMTTGYERNEEGLSAPILADYVPEWYEREQLSYHCDYAVEMALHLDWKGLNSSNLSSSVKKLVRKSSIFPSLSTATVYGSIPFCDDSTESYKLPLAKHISFRILLGNLLIMRLYTKFMAKDKGKSEAESFWSEATIGFLPIHQQIILRVDKHLEYLLKALRKSFMIIFNI